MFRYIKEKQPVAIKRAHAHFPSATPYGRKRNVMHDDSSQYRKRQKRTTAEYDTSGESEDDELSGSQDDKETSSSGEEVVAKKPCRSNGKAKLKSR
jgi:hypothetical protein